MQFDPTQAQSILNADAGFQMAIQKGKADFWSHGGPRIMQDRVQSDINTAAQQALARAGMQMPNDWAASFHPGTPTTAPTATIHQQSFLEQHPWVLPVSVIGGAGLGAAALGAFGAGEAGAGGAAAASAAPAATGGTAATVGGTAAAAGGVGSTLRTIAPYVAPIAAGAVSAALAPQPQIRQTLRGTAADPVSWLANGRSLLEGEIGKAQSRAADPVDLSGAAPQRPAMRLPGMAPSTIPEPVTPGTAGIAPKQIPLAGQMGAAPAPLSSQSQGAAALLLHALSAAPGRSLLGNG